MGYGATDPFPEPLPICVPLVALLGASMSRVHARHATAIRLDPAILHLLVESRSTPRRRCNVPQALWAVTCRPHLSLA